MGDDDIRELAQQAGVSTRWVDYRGVARTVSVETLRRVLDALQPVGEGHAPTVVVGRCGEPLALPAALPDGQLRLRAENGEYGELPVRGGTVTTPAEPGYYTLELGDGELVIAAAPAPGAAEAAIAGRRQWALAVQLYALRRGGDGGIGSYRALADLVREAAAAGAHGIAVSPMHAAFSADAGHYSPYAPSNRLLANAMHIDVATALPELDSPVLFADWVAEEGLGDELQRLDRLPLVDWRAAWPLKLRLLRRLWNRFRAIGRAEPLQVEFSDFVRRGGGALRDHARFEMLHALQFGADPAHWHWRTWPQALHQPDGAAVRRLAQRHADEVGFHTFLQWLADRGLGLAQAAAQSAGMPIGLIADLAVGSCGGGSQSWSSPDDLLRGLSLGAPPDLFNRRGQDWGLTTFSPQSLQRHGYAPFIDMVRAALRHAGGVRIDHILGLRRLWVVPEGSEPGEGAYLAYPFDDLRNLLALEAWRHQALIIGEDLGTVPEGFRAALQESGILGMEVLWFERDHGFFIDPARWSPRAAAMTSTHDLPTVAGWWQRRDLAWRGQLGKLEGEQAEAAQAERDRDRAALWGAFIHAGIAPSSPPPKEAPPVVSAALGFIALTPAPLAIVPVEDLLGLEEQANLPDTLDEHPNWCRRLPQPFGRAVQEGEVAARLETLRRERP